MCPWLTHFPSRFCSGRPRGRANVQIKALLLVGFQAQGRLRPSLRRCVLSQSPGSAASRTGGLASTLITELAVPTLPRLPTRCAGTSEKHLLLHRDRGGASSSGFPRARALALLGFLSSVLSLASPRSERRRRRQEQQLRRPQHAVPHTAGVFYADRSFKRQEKFIFTLCVETLKLGETEECTQSGLTPESGFSSVAFQ